ASASAKRGVLNEVRAIISAACATSTWSRVMEGCRRLDGFMLCSCRYRGGMNTTAPFFLLYRRAGNRPARTAVKVGTPLLPSEALTQQSEPGGSDEQRTERGTAQLSLQLHRRQQALLRTRHTWRSRGRAARPAPPALERAHQGRLRMRSATNWQRPG